MATIALVWEFGSGLGHITTLQPIVRRLKSLGHRPVMVLRDVHRVQSVFGDEDIEYIQAPCWLPRLPKGFSQLNFTETLFHFGYLNASGLTAMVKAWHSTLSLLKPDIILFDHSPTALLASRAMNTRKVLFGNSFTLLPDEKAITRLSILEATRRYCQQDY